MLGFNFASLQFTCTLVVYDNDAIGRDNALGSLERRGDRSFGEQLFSGAKSHREYHKPKCVDQIMLDQCLEQVAASPDVDLRTGLLFDLGDFCRDVSA